MKRFIILSISILAAIGAWACCYNGHPHYYVFSAFPASAMNFGQTSNESLANYWSKYTGQESAEWALSEFAGGNVDCSAASQNTIVKAAYKKNDTETIDYLKLLNSYFSCANVVYNTNEWNYPSKEEIASSKARLKALRNKVLSQTDETHKAQYILLAMRCNKALGFHSANINYWKANSHHMPKSSALRRQAMGIYAHALLQTGKRDEAMKYYATVGDMASIKWMVRKQRNLKGIKQEYERDSNSPALTFLVQDFVNNAQETRDNNDLQFIKMVGAEPIFNHEMEQFVGFARQVMAEGKTKEPALWMTAAGYLTGMLGKPQEAVDMLTKAMSMKGTQRMTDNARVCRLMTTIEHMAVLNPSDSQLLTEMKWLSSTDAAARPQGDMHYRQMMVRAAYHGFIPFYTAAGNKNMATSMALMLNAYESEGSAAFNGKASATSALQQPLDSLSSSQLAAYRNFVKSSSANDFAKWVNQACLRYLSDNSFNDLMGTKLMREGQFASAIPYLEKVPLAYVSSQNISCYMARRSFLTEAWFSRVSVRNEMPTKVSANQKLLFCRRYVEMEHSTDPRTRYQLGTMLYQASYKGDCWFLTRYAKSVADTICYPGEADLMKMAASHLAAAAKSSDFALKQKALYALAFMPQGGDLISRKYTADYARSYLVLNRRTPRYDAMLNLLNFANANRANVAPYVSKCDVLKQFQQLYAKKPATTKKKTAARRRR